MVLAALPLLLQLVPPNRWYGFRLPGTRLNPELWYSVNAVGAKLFISAMVVCAMLNLLLFWKGTEPMKNLAGWINGLLIVISFWLVSLELLKLVP